MAVLKRVAKWGRLVHTRRGRIQEMSQTSAMKNIRSSHALNLYDAPADPAGAVNALANSEYDPSSAQSGQASPSWAKTRKDISAGFEREETKVVSRTNIKAQGLASAWARITTRLRAELGDDLYSSWFARMEAEEYCDNRLIVSVPTRFLRNWIQAHYIDKLVEIAGSELGGVEVAQIRVRSRGVPVADEHDESVSAPARSESSDTEHAHVRDRAPSQEMPAAAGEEKGSPLDWRLTFATFVTGGSNALAHAAALRVAEAAPDAAMSFNPLFIHSASGLGKTHLLNAIAWRIRERAARRKVIYLTAERFMYQFINALRTRDVIPFKDFFQSADVLLIDDFQFLQGRSMQQEFGHTLNSLVDSRRQVIIAADVPPGQLDSIDGRMRSRLTGGLVVDIEAPELELRRRILRARLDEARSREADLFVPDEVVEFIANRVNGGGRELEGALNRVVAHHQLTRTPICVDVAATCLRDLVHSQDPHRVKIDDIMRIIGRHYNVAKADLLSPRRARSIVRPRQVGMYLAKKLTSRSLPEIGRRFGGRDHSTVLHAVRKVEELMEKDEQMQREVQLLTRLLEQP